MMDQPATPSAGLAINALTYAAAAAAAAALIWLAAARLPQTARKPLLLPAAVGLVAAAGSASLLARWGVSPPARLWHAAVAVGLGLAGSSAWYLGHSFSAVAARAQSQLQALQTPPLDDEFEKLFSTPPKDADPAAAAAWADARRQFLEGRQKRAAWRQDLQALTSLPGYLASRIPPAWGVWRQPWPALFWILETVLSSALGGYAAVRCAALCRPQRAGNRPSGPT